MKVIPFLIAALACCSIAVASDDNDQERAAFFETKIRPVLVQHCYSCHSADAKHVRGGLRLDSAEATLDGGESGSVLEAGHPDDSLLISSLKHESFEMPPSGKLSDEIIADFEKWIRDGAYDPRTGGRTVERRKIDLEAGREFWSFRPVKSPAVPQHDSAWGLNEIDRLIERGYLKDNITPAGDGTSGEIIRRLSFALRGLPPTEEEIRQFESDFATEADHAILKWTDRWLDSPEYAQRWARHWLDVTRFSESSGGGRSLLFPHAYRFRDYVIQSFAEDKPLPQLIREHIAGDLLPFATQEQRDEQLVGVGYLVLGPNNYEQQDKELLRMDVIDEQITTIGRTFLGMTLGCARCHDHKFDPIPASDYYAMAGIFRSTESLVFGNVSGYVTTALKSVPEASQYKSWRQEIDELSARLKSVDAKLKSTGDRTYTSTVSAAEIPGIVVDDTQAIFEGRWVHSVHIKTHVEDGYQHNDSQQNGHKVTFRTTLPKSGEYEVRFAWNAGPSRCNHLPITIRHADGDSVVEIDQREEPENGLFGSLGVFQFDAAQPAEVIVGDRKPGSGYVITDAVQFLPVASATAEQRRMETKKQNELLAVQKDLRKQIEDLRQRKVSEPKAMSVRDRKAAADWHLHVRGEVRNLGKIVPRGVLSVAIPRDEHGKDQPLSISSGSGRKELAEWIASEKNPLTARVYVNRVWQHLIGEGIVRTPDNFGMTGQRPTHPDLLDYLAHVFVHEDHWSTKKLIRRIVQSRVFRLQTRHPEAEGMDPENRMLARAFRRQLDAEALRDSMLQVSAELDLSVTGGRTIQKLTTYDNDYRHSRYPTTVRSIFVPFFRNAPLPFLATFDGVNSNMVSGRRSQSTLPAQALYLMNSDFVLQQSRQAASRFLERFPDDRSGLLTSAFLETLGRPPTEPERQLMESWLQSSADPQEALTGLFQSLFSSIDFRYLN